MRKSVRLYLQASVCAVVALCSSCGLSRLTAKQEPTELEKNPPRALLVMPPINQTNHVEAKEYVYASLVNPLIERGYYVFSPYLSLDLLQQESAADAEMFESRSLKPFQSVFQADAVLFTRIKRWEKDVLSSNITAEIEFELRSTETGNTLFKRDLTRTVNTAATSSGGLFGAIVNAISTATTDRVVAARVLTKEAASLLPLGPYAVEK